MSETTRIHNDGRTVTLQGGRIRSGKRRKRTKRTTASTARLHIVPAVPQVPQLTAEDIRLLQLGLDVRDGKYRLGVMDLDVQEGEIWFTTPPDGIPFKVSFPPEVARTSALTCLLSYLASWKTGGEKKHRQKIERRTGVGVGLEVSREEGAITIWGDPHRIVDTLDLIFAPR